MFAEERIAERAKVRVLPQSIKNVVYRSQYNDDICCSVFVYVTSGVSIVCVNVCLHHHVVCKNVASQAKKTRNDDKDKQLPVEPLSDVSFKLNASTCMRVLSSVRYCKQKIGST